MHSMRCTESHNSARFLIDCAVASCPPFLWRGGRVGGVEAGQAGRGGGRVGLGLQAVGLRARACTQVSGFAKHSFRFDSREISKTNSWLHDLLSSSVEAGFA